MWTTFVAVVAGPLSTVVAGPLSTVVAGPLSTNTVPAYGHNNFQ